MPQPARSFPVTLTSSTARGSKGITFLAAPFLEQFYFEIALATARAGARRRDASAASPVATQEATDEDSTAIYLRG